MSEIGVCPNCAETVLLGDRFCEACGANLHVRAGGTADSVDCAASCRGCRTVLGPGEEYCPECGLRGADPTDRVETDLGTLAGVSDRGLVHARNEDAMALGHRADTGVVAMVVCDGVSTVRAPEQAARAAARTALDVLLSEPNDLLPSGPGRAPAHACRESAQQAQRLVESAVARAAAEVAGLAVPGEAAAPSCTLLCALVTPGPLVTLGWLGDSRAYWLAAPQPGEPRPDAPPSDEPSQLLTTDHSWATAMVRAGVLDERTAQRDRRAHALTRWLGPDGDNRPEVFSWQPAGPGSLLLCSDGLWNYHPDPAELAAIAGAATPLAAARTLTQHALDAGGRDNITVCLAQLVTHPPGNG